MIPTFQQVRLALDVEARAAFDPAPANQTEAGVKAGEANVAVAPVKGLPLPQR